MSFHSSCFVFNCIPFFSLCWVSLFVCECSFFLLLHRLLAFCVFLFCLPHFFLPFAFLFLLYELIHFIRSIWLVFQFYCAFSPHIVIQNWWKGSWDTNWKFSLDVYIFLFFLFDVFLKSESFRMYFRSLYSTCFDLKKRFERHDNMAKLKCYKKNDPMLTSLRWFEQKQLNV